ncbi:unnamed protein product [[Candida] boidinii]|nr:unnamed protein product [[Candida] boidinii]
MQPVIGTDLTILKNVSKSCGCCGIGAGGLMKCDLCEETIHVTCALDSAGYFVGFKLDKCDIKDKNCVKIKKTGVYGKPRPIIICKDHKFNNDDERLVSMRTFVKYKARPEMPLIEVYIQEFKKCEQSLNGGLLKKKLFDEALIYSKNINANADGIVKCNSMGEITFDLSTFDSDKNSCKQPVKCKHCGNTQTLKWHDDSAVKKEASSDNIVDAGKIEHENGKLH